MEGACRIALTIHFILVALGYIEYFQTRYQLTSPVIPKSMIMLIARPYLEVSLAVAPLFLISLYCYFFQRRTITLIISLGSVFIYVAVIRYFVQYL